MTQTIDEIIIEGSSLVKALQKAGVPASIYAKPPAGRASFIISRGPGIPGSILVWPGDAEIEMSTDRTKKQAILSVTEKPRKVERTVVTWMPNDREPTTSDWTQSFGIAMPVGTRYKAVGATKEVDQYGFHRSAWRAKVVATTRKTVTHFLVGIDESACFVCALPRKPKDVADAHRILRPPGVKEGTPRQGEFFFVPVPAREQKEIEEFNMPRGSAPYKLESRSSHEATEMRQHDRQKWVRGTITDRRRGHHQSLTLETWHRVVRNAEIVNPSTQRSTRWD